VQKIHDKVLAVIARNPLGWLAFAALLFAQYNLYKRGGELDDVCLLLSSFVNLDSVHGRPKNEVERSVEICYDRFSGYDYESQN
jgi:hypothetical protein